VDPDSCQNGIGTANDTIYWSNKIMILCNSAMVWSVMLQNTIILQMTTTLSEDKLITVEPGYNDIGLYVNSSIASDIVVLINSSLLTITSQHSLRTTPVYNNTKYSVPFMTL